jgi:hypothetical protein
MKWKETEERFLKEAIKYDIPIIEIVNRYKGIRSRKAVYAKVKRMKESRRIYELENYEEWNRLLLVDKTLNLKNNYEDNFNKIWVKVQEENAKEVDEDFHTTKEELGSMVELHGIDKYLAAYGI